MLNVASVAFSEIHPLPPQTVWDAIPPRLSCSCLEATHSLPAPTPEMVVFPFAVALSIDFLLALRCVVTPSPVWALVSLCGFEESRGVFKCFLARARVIRDILRVPLSPPPASGESRIFYIQSHGHKEVAVEDDLPHFLSFFLKKRNSCYLFLFSLLSPGFVFFLSRPPLFFFEPLPLKTSHQ